MNALEKLMAEFDNEITFIVKRDMPKSLPGLIVGKTIYINADIPFDKCLSVLAEEIGHYKTLPEGSDISDYSKLANRKLELKGRRWGYKKLVPIEKLNKFVKYKESVQIYEIAEHFEIPGDVAQEVVEMYRVEGMI